ncbi:uncharacterized protein LOC134535658 [Bacillus rossius redtenbacheri]|uniref:uncharacterized protein LOC134535658 n=1 Tax=Bacillus rossius redtenbacheri TaxID=93214 RepID=UPI002FDCA75D
MAFINCEARGRCENAFEREKATAGEMAQSLDGRLYLSCSSSNGYYGYLPVSRPDDCAMDTEEPERHAVQATGPARRRKASAVSDNHVVAKRPRLEEALVNRCAPQPPTRIVQYPRCIMGHLI